MEEEFGIVTRHENPAYTSQECSSDTERKYHLRHSDAVSLLSANPYFAGNLAQLKGS
jgi:hypothetical protein